VVCSKKGVASKTTLFYLYFFNLKKKQQQEAYDIILLSAYPSVPVNQSAYPLHFLGS
jgi:hypothetical protein